MKHSMKILTNNTCPASINRFCPMDSLRLMDSFAVDFQGCCMSLLINNLAAVDDFLSAQYDAVGP